MQSTDIGSEQPQKQPMSQLDIWQSVNAYKNTDRREVNMKHWSGAGRLHSGQRQPKCHNANDTRKSEGKSTFTLDRAAGSPSWLPNQMISVSLLFGFPRWPSDRQPTQIWRAECARVSPSGWVRVRCAEVGGAVVTFIQAKPHNPPNSTIQESDKLHNPKK